MNQSLHPATRLGAVHLNVSNLDRSLAFYQNNLGFQLHRRQGDTAYLGAGQHDFLVLVERAGARKERGRSGLYHFAVLVPSRFDLARVLKHIAETRTPVEGFADHLVSEAIYLPDVDGNGIEIYCDRPRDEWPRSDDGQLRMATDPLDIDGLLAELDGRDGTRTGLAPGTTLGHMHLHVADIPEAVAFYCDVIGFDLIMRYGPSAAFLSAGGYHHHLGVNTWAGVGALPASPDSVGLRYWEILVANAAELSKVADRARHAGVALEERESGLFLRDPSRNGVVLTEQR